MRVVPPILLELQLKRLEMQTCRKLADRLGPGFVFLCAALMAAAIHQWKLDELRRPEFMPNGGFFVVQLVHTGVALAILLSPLTLLVRDRFQPLLQSLILTIVWLASVFSHFGAVDSLWLRILLIVSVPFHCVMGWFYLFSCRSERVKRLGAAVYTLCFWLLNMAIFVGLYRLQEYRALSTYWRVKTEFIWIMILYTGLNTRTGAREATIAINPSNALRGSLWPMGAALTKSEQGERLRIWWQGILNLSVGYALIAARMVLEKNLYNRIKIPYFHYCFRYVLAVTAIIGVLNILSGAIRIMGYRVPDATRFMWLAQSPAEYWRRGAFYQYLFITRSIFVPVLRWTRVPILATSVAFFVFLVNKSGALDLVLLAFTKTNFLSVDVQREKALILMWCIWLVLLLITRKKWINNEMQGLHPYRAWFSVGLTHLIMSSIYYFSHVLFGLF